MKVKKRLAIIASISAMGIVLTLMGMRIGTSYASPPAQSPTPSADLSADMGSLPGVLSTQAYSITRIQTVTLEPLMDDLMSGTWPIFVQDTYYNWPQGATLNFPDDAEDKTLEVPTGIIDVANVTTIIPGQQAWMKVAYRKRSPQTLGSNAVRSGNLVTLTIKASTSYPGAYLDPLISTLVYTRYFPTRPRVSKDAAPDHWGVSPAPEYVVSRDPTPYAQTDEFVEWVTTTRSFAGKVVLSDTIFGSDLTVTYFAVDPHTPTLYSRIYSTVTIQNAGPMTAWRWFRTEFYLKPENDQAPKDALDHSWGQIIYHDPAVFHKPGTEFNWPVAELGPSESITLVTAITVVRASGSGRLKAYAQVDTGETGDAVHYAWFGSNPEGYCNLPQGCDVNTRPPQEYNVATLQDGSGHDQIILIPEVYAVDISPRSDTRKAPAGKQATFYLRVDNMGNVTDTYTVTVVSGPHAWTVPSPFTVGPVPYEYPPNSGVNSRTFTIAVTVPPGTLEDDWTWVTVTVRSARDPGHIESDTVKLKTIAGYYHYYLPTVRKKS